MDGPSGCCSGGAGGLLLMAKGRIGASYHVRSRAARPAVQCPGAVWPPALTSQRDSGWLRRLTNGMSGQWRVGDEHAAAGTIAAQLMALSERRSAVWRHHLICHGAPITARRAAPRIVISCPNRRCRPAKPVRYSTCACLRAGRRACVRAPGVHPFIMSSRPVGDKTALLATGRPPPSCLTADTSHRERRLRPADDQRLL